MAVLLIAATLAVFFALGFMCGIMITNRKAKR